MLTTSITHKGILAASKVLSSSMLECLCDESILTAVRETFADEIGDTVYEPMIPLGREPMLRPHQALMSHYRPLMRKHYRTDRPHFETAQSRKP